MTSKDAHKLINSCATVIFFLGIVASSFAFGFISARVGTEHFCITTPIELPTQLEIQQLLNGIERETTSASE